MASQYCVCHTEKQYISPVERLPQTTLKSEVYSERCLSIRLRTEFVTKVGIVSYCIGDLPSKTSQIRLRRTNSETKIGYNVLLVYEIITSTSTMAIPWSG
jgi:hypothetical protein